MSPLPLIGPPGTFTWRMLAVVLAAQSILLFFGALVARGLTLGSGTSGEGNRLLLLGSGIAVTAIVAAGLMRTPWGLPLGWLVQIATWASALVVPAMAGVGVVFTALWIYSLVKGRQAEELVARRQRAADPG